MNEEIKPENMRIHSRADELIACLEGEIAKRDARIAELENDASHYAARNEELRAAPVSEAKAQGVVQWPNADEIMQMAFEEGQPADDASGYYFELEEFDLFIERLMSDVARLNAAPAQQVSVTDGWRSMVDHLASTVENINEVARGQITDDMEDPDYEHGLCDKHDDLVREARAMLDAAPAAPAADAGLVEALELAANRLDRLALEQGEFWRGYATAWADEARATANGVKS